MPLNIGGNTINSEIVNKYPNTRISKAGLVLHLDASSLESYPGTGNTWYDISGNGRNYTFGGGITWNAAGYFTNDGSGVFTGPASNTFGFNNYGEATVEAFTQVLSATGNVFCSWYGTNSNANDNRTIFTHFYYSNGNTYFDQNGCCGADQRISYANDSDWTAGIRHFAIRMRSNVTPNRQIFKNTVSQVDSGGYSTATINWDSAQSAIIANLWHGRIYSFKAYNRPLTDTELLNNYNIGKVKHGL
jgi:hypothetical protein